MKIAIIFGSIALELKYYVRDEKVIICLPL